MAAVVIEVKDGEAGGKSNVAMVGEDNPDPYNDYELYEDYESGRPEEEICELELLQQGG